MFDFRIPFGNDVFERRRTSDAEANQKHVRLEKENKDDINDRNRQKASVRRGTISVAHLWIRERSQPIVILLAGRVPEAETDGNAVDHHGRRIVIEPVKRQTL